MPFIVYLDTQDYINLFNEVSNGPNHQVLKELLRFRDSGKISIGFSLFTILEFITRPDAENREERVRRGALVKSICGPNAFPNISEIVKGATFPNGGQWLFSKDHKIITANQFRRGLHKTFIRELPKYRALNRKQRRQLARKPAMEKWFRNNDSTFGQKRSDYGSIPVSNEIIESRVLERFLKGKCSDAEFEQRMNAWLTDPEEYSRIVYDYSDQPNVLDAHFGEAINAVEATVVASQEILNNVRQTNQTLLAAREKMVDAGSHRSQAKRLTRQFALPIPDFEPITKKLEESFGKGRAGHIGYYLAHLLKSNQKFKRSDVIDLLQLSYAYDCDLFRCDKAMANIFSSFQLFNGKLVGRFHELPGLISKL